MSSQPRSTAAEQPSTATTTTATAVTDWTVTETHIVPTDSVTQVEITVERETVDHVAGVGIVPERETETYRARRERGRYTLAASDIADVPAAVVTALDDLNH